jgi:glycosyltransferase involved in cell wall biosynthesis
MPRFLLVIPAFSEGGRLPVFAEALLPVLVASGISVEVQVVDDGSPEEHRVALVVLCDELHARWAGWRPLLALPVNQGKGGAVYSGWDTAGEASWLGFCDADGSVSADEVVRLMKLIHESGHASECVIATRGTATGKPVRRTWRRSLLSSLFTAWARWCTGLNIPDTQCGCKFVPMEVYRAIRPQLRDRRFAFDVELLLRAVQSGVAVRMEPVTWTARPGGSLRLWSDGAAMVVAVWRLRAREKQIAR